MYFVVFGVVDHLPSPDSYHMTKINVHCNGIQAYQDTVFFNETTMSSDLSYIVRVNPNGKFALSCTHESILLFDLITLQNFARKIFDSKLQFWPEALSISDKFIFLGGYHKTERYESKLYLLILTTDYNVTIADVWSGKTIFGRYPDNTLSVNILWALNEPDTVYLFTVNQSRPQFQHISFMLTRATVVAWLNEGEKAVMTYTNYLFIYNMRKDMKFDNRTVPSSMFPINVQSVLLEPLLSIQSSDLNNALYILTEAQVIILTPSRPGYYSVPDLFVTKLGVNLREELVISYIPDKAQCPTGTYKSDLGWWPCSRCQTTPNSTCRQCTVKEFCPGEFTAPIDQFEDIHQNYGHQKFSDIDGFDALILYNIFRTDCGINSPFYIILISFTTVFLLSILIFFLKTVKRLRLDMHQFQ